MFTGNQVSPLERRHPILTGMAAGLVAGAVAGASEKLLDRLVSKKQKRRDRKVREGSAHQVAGPRFASKLLGRRLDPQEKRRANLAFGVAYGVGWGLIHGGLRKRFPLLGRWGGLPFTPRMHGIHHSVVRGETDSNWGTIFSWPDYLQGTVRLNVLQDGIDIGVVGYQDPAQLTLGKVLAMPFQPEIKAIAPEGRLLPVPRTALAP
ncbi:sterol desaturase family protein [Citrifermentans bremense]|uniref:sterol desaturase family protein n=1 Tax=Citrifermentans bremense TaxID=60035 RepID=UPI000412AC8E|nr:sterol desaturase family protein [Citrifermentans bremense]